MTKLNFMETEIEDLKVKDLKDLIKESGLKVKGYHDMNKKDLIQNVIEIYGDFIEYEKIVEDNENKKKNKFLYIVKNPEGEIVKKFEKLKDVYEYAESHGICSKGWVSLSIERDIPVLIGLGRDKEITEDFVPRVTKKYNGNYWKFEKEEI